MKITIEDAPAEYLKWLSELYDRLTVIATQADKARRLLLELNQRMSPRKEEGKSEPGVQPSGEGT